MTDCPPDALSRTPEGEILIDEATCIGCNQCADNCPYGVIQMAPKTPPPSRWSALWSFLGGRAARTSADEGKKVAVKCDLCEQLQRRAGRPAAACVAGCPTGAILRVNPKDYLDRLMSAADA
jgi:Fe-S-cluster-containing hydrogenase component 2